LKNRIPLQSRLKGGFFDMTFLRRRALAAVLLALAATAIGAVFSTAQEGGAASTVAPSNSTPPTISGTPRVGSTLTADPGKWNGTTPITFTYQWRRCDGDGGSCSNISGATEKTYVLKQVDQDNTLRIRVTAKNNDGSAQSTSVPTAAIQAAAPVPPPVVNGCPAGTGVIQIADLKPPARLLLDKQEVSPTVIGRSSQDITVRFRVSACGGRPVQGALVYTTAVPFQQFTIPAETPTGADGWATMQMHQLGGFPAARQQQLLVLFTRARKSGEDVLGGISSRRLTSFRVDLNR
jgi:hypothetical protein